MMSNPRRTNAIALAILKGLAFLAVGLLVLILGYLIFRGVWKSTRSESLVVPTQIVSTLDVPATPMPFSVAANKQANLKDISWFAMKRIATGNLASLRTLSSTDEWISLMVEDTVADAFMHEFSVTAEDLAHAEAFIGTRGQILAKAKDDAGAIMILAPGTSHSGFATVNLESQVVMVNSDVVQLYGNKRIGILSADELKLLVGGKIANWEQLHGGDIAVTYVPHASASQIAALPGSMTIVPAREYQQAVDASQTVSLLNVEKITNSANLTWGYLTEQPIEGGKYGGILSIIGNTFIMVLLTAVFAAPVGIASAVYLCEYAKENWLTRTIRNGIDVLAGIPSIIFGLFGMLVFVQLFKWSFSLISGTLTVALMILPTIIRTSEEAIKSVDTGLRNASIALGATRLETIWKVILPGASKGITTGLILAIGRAMGETAALVYTIGSATGFVSSLGSSSRVLSTHIYLIVTEGQSLDRAFASALVLIVLVLFINMIAKAVMNGSSRSGRK